MGNTKKPSLKPVIKRTFKELFGEVLNPLGYVFAKTKKPCFVRIVNGDIGHIVHLEDIQSAFIRVFLHYIGTS